MVVNQRIVMDEVSVLYYFTKLLDKFKRGFFLNDPNNCLESRLRSQQEGFKFVLTLK